LCVAIAISNANVIIAAGVHGVSKLIESAPANATISGQYGSGTMTEKSTP
jgi:hypothetical protein